MMTWLTEARFIPHWFACLVVMGLTGGVVWMLLNGSSAYTVVAADVTCPVTEVVSTAQRLYVRMSCNGREVELTDNREVYAYLTVNTKTMRCEKVYENGAVEKCAGIR